MTSSLLTAMATLALALVLIGSILTGHLFVVHALLSNTPVIDYQKNTNTTTTTINTTPPQTSPFDPARVLVQDAIIALQNSDNNKALVHLKLADQQLAALPNGVNSSFVQPVRTLLADAVQALVQNSDIDNNKALVHLKLADQQLAIATSSENNMKSPILSTVSSSTLNHNPLPSSPVYIHKTTDINKNKIIVTAPQDSKKGKGKDPSMPYYDPDFPDKPANMPFCSQPKANANHKVCYDESDNPHPPCTKYPDNPACGTGKNVARQGQPVKSCNPSQDSACITSITSTLQPENLSFCNWRWPT